MIKKGDYVKIKPDPLRRLNRELRIMYDCKEVSDIQRVDKVVKNSISFGTPMSYIQIQVPLIPIEIHFDPGPQRYSVEHFYLQDVVPLSGLDKLGDFV